jgi:hypothetical protein
MPKTVRRLSNITSLRGATPTTPDLAANFMNFRFNHLRQRAVHPTRLGSADGFTTTNASGTAADHAGVGQVLGRGGMPWTDPGQVKIDQDG